MERGNLQLCRHVALSQSHPAHPLAERPIHFLAGLVRPLPFPLPNDSVTIEGRDFSQADGWKEVFEIGKYQED